MKSQNGHEISKRFLMRLNLQMFAEPAADGAGAAGDDAPGGDVTAPATDAQKSDGANTQGDNGGTEVEKLNAEAGETVTFDQVLAVVDGEVANFGAPLLSGASVTAKVEKNGKSKKIRVYKMKPKKGYRRTQGHRQPYTKVTIEAINA